MNKKTIKTNAGIIWNLLNDHQKWGIPRLCKASGLSEKEVHTAIGWLACENKIEIGQASGSEEQFYLIVEYYF